MPDEPLPSGWLPPRPPPHWPAPSPRRAPSRPSTESPTPPTTPAPRQPRQPSSPVALAGIASGSAGLLLLVFSAGISFPFTIGLSLVALMLGTVARRRLEAGAPGRPGQARAAVVVGAVGLGLAAVAAVVWMILAANGITPQDLQDSLQREAERLRGR
jgi:hypothetical protein